MKKELGLFILLLVLCLAVVGTELGIQLHNGATVAQLQAPKFTTATNLTNLANLVGMFGIFSIGMGMIIITGGIDLSVGSMFALVGVILSIMLREWHWPWPVATLSILFLPMALASLHGLLITRVKMQPFIVTLCGLLIYRSMAQFIAHDETKGFGNAAGFERLKYFATGKFFAIDSSFRGIPAPFVYLIVVVIIMWFVLHRSVYGRYLYAVGRNEQAARFSGINTKLVIASAYILSGLLAGISAILFAFYTNSITPSTHGNAYELYGIAAAVLGGCSLRGGEGSICGIIIGTALLLVLQNLVNLLGIPSSLNLTVMGAVVLIGVLTDQFFQNRRTKS